MLPRLEAEEKLAAINVAALAAGAGEPLERERIFQSLQRKAAGEAAPEPVKADPGDLAAMGIAISGADGDLPVITDLDGWLGNGEQGHPSSSEAIGEKERG